MNRRGFFGNLLKGAAAVAALPAAKAIAESIPEPVETVPNAVKLVPETTTVPVDVFKHTNYGINFEVTPDMLNAEMNSVQQQMRRLFGQSRDYGSTAIDIHQMWLCSTTSSCATTLWQSS